MKDELCSKIQAIVDRKIRKQMQVVYPLVEARKLMDRENYTDPVLRTFSNWVVHTGLENRADGSTLILKQFDSFIAQLYERQLMHKDKVYVSLGSFRESPDGLLQALPSERIVLEGFEGVKNILLALLFQRERASSGVHCIQRKAEVHKEG